MNKDPGTKKPQEPEEPPAVHPQKDSLEEITIFRGPRWLRIAQWMGTGVAVVAFGVGTALGVDRPRPAVEATVHSADDQDVHAKNYKGEDITLEPGIAITVMCDDGPKGYEVYVKGGDHPGEFAHLLGSEIEAPPLDNKLTNKTYPALDVLEDC